MNQKQQYKEIEQNHPDMSCTLQSPKQSLRSRLNTSFYRVHAAINLTNDCYGMLTGDIQEIFATEEPTSHLDAIAMIECSVDKLIDRLQILHDELF